MLLLLYLVHDLDHVLVGLHFEDNTVLVTRGKQWRLFFQIRQSRHKLLLGSFIILVIKTKISAISFRMDFQITLYLQHVSFDYVFSTLQHSANCTDLETISWASM